MGQLISIPFKSNLDALFASGISEATSFGGKVVGDKWSGFFSIPALGGTFEGTYKVSNNIIQFDLTKKPFMISHWIIDSFLKAHIK
ncbi:hypothetical protein FHW88_002784 [Mucilaginibacter sp. SG538B]|uniref:hypothetical protein n=1 Tax=Mucilaginibacter sp. SG538B TaxID=2587021 RepID=UPI00159D1645|nr:hypothetical protein [Mucilaginibacter sp. SG538B]NVM64495.1 hypothetical protein [Mucilaginibacter sp. SG538B]